MTYRSSPSFAIGGDLERRPVAIFITSRSLSLSALAALRDDYGRAGNAPKLPVLEAGEPIYPLRGYRPGSRIWP